MDLEYINRIFEYTDVKRNADFLTIGYPHIKEKKKMLVFIKNKKYINALRGNDNISAVITSEEYSEQILCSTNCGVLVTENPEKTFYLIHNYLYNKEDFYEKEKNKTVIGANADIASNAVIAENNVRIGENVRIEPGVIIMENVKIGNNCLIGANTVIGTRGFQYFKSGDDAFYIEHVSGVIIQNNVEIFSGCCIAGGLVTPTYICDNTKVDNHVHIGHSAYLSKRVLIAAGTVVGGSAYIGQRTWIGPGSVISSLVHIGDDAFVCVGSVVANDIKNGQKVSGNFALEHERQMALELFKRRLT